MNLFLKCWRLAKKLNIHLKRLHHSPDLRRCYLNYFRASCRDPAVSERLCVTLHDHRQHKHVNAPSSVGLSLARAFTGDRDKNISMLKCVLPQLLLARYFKALVD